MKLTYQEQVPLSQVDECNREFQPRIDYSYNAIEALRKDIARNGQHNPIGLLKQGESYQVIYGFQRVIALKLNDQTTVRANIYEDATWEELHEQAISNNERHMDLNDLERAIYVGELKDRGLGIDKLSELFGVNKSVIYNLLSVAKLDETTKECLKIEKITLNHAVELARLDVSKRLETLVTVLGHSLSLKQLKRHISGNGFKTSLPLAGWIPLCPKYLTLTSLGKHPTEDELRAKGRGEDAIKREMALANERQSCLDCVDFSGRNGESVNCGFDGEQLSAGIKSLMVVAGWTL